MKRTVLLFGLAVFALTFLGITHVYRVAGPTYQDGFTITPKFPHGGYDFNLCYDWVAKMLHGQPNSVMYPPSTAIIYLPFEALPAPLAYYLFTYLVIGAMFMAVFLSLSEDRSLDWVDALMLSGAFFAIIYNSYWFQLEMERGNSNSFVSFTCAIGLIALTRGRMLAATLLFVAAAQLRIYPAIMVAFLALRAGFRPVVLFVVLNVLLLFSCGHDNLKAFIDIIRYWQGQTLAYDMNHSLATAGALYGFYTHTRFLKGVLLVLFSGLWFLVRCREQRVTGRAGRLSLAEAGLVGLAFQLMDLLPNVSWDYKLGIQTVPFLLVASHRGWKKYPALVWMPLIGALAVAYAYVCVPAHRPKSPSYLVQVIVYTIIVLIAVKQRRGRRSSPAVEAPPPSIADPAAA